MLVPPGLQPWEATLSAPLRGLFRAKHWLPAAAAAPQAAPRCRPGLNRGWGSATPRTPPCRHPSSKENDRYVTPRLSPRKTGGRVTPLRSSAYLSAERAGAGGAAAVPRFGQQEEGAL